jgi:hypothetical protein
MNVEPLIHAIASAFLFLEESGADEVHPDSAVKAMENIGYPLDQMSAADRQEFVRTLEKMAASAESPAYAAYLRNMPYMLWGPQDH